MTISMSCSRNKLKILFSTLFSEKYLFLTNVSISVLLSGLGDIIEQHVEIMNNALDKWDPIRTRNMSASGLTVGVLCHKWYILLDKYLPGYTFRTVLKKVLLDQLIGSPLNIATFFITVGYMENTSKDELINEIRKKFWILYAAEWIIWPPAQMINFYWLPTKYRVLYDNTISLGYDTYTSYIKHYHYVDDDDKDNSVKTNVSKDKP